MIYILLPVKKNEEKIGKIISRLRADLSPFQYKIITIVDGENDAALDELRTIKGRDLLVRSNRIRMGMGAIMSVGFITAIVDSDRDDDYIVTMEGDQVNSQDLLCDLLQGLDAGNDIVIASRYKAKDGYKDFPIKRKFFSCKVNYLIRWLFPIPEVFDYTIFLRAYRIKVLNEAIEHFGKYGLVQARGSVSNTELLIKLSIFTERILEVPYTYRTSKRSAMYNISVLGTINEYFVLIAYLKRLFGKVERYKKLQAMDNSVALRID